MTRTLATLAAVLLLALAGCGGDDEPSAQDVELANALEEGGVVLVMRHAITEPQTDRVEKVERAYARFGVFALAIPALLPPPLPFKIFVATAGALFT